MAYIPRKSSKESFAIEKPSESETKNNNGNYSFSIKSDAKLVKKQLGDVTADDLDYTGSTLAPEIIVTDINGAELTQGTDYTVKYNPAVVKNAGTHKATIKGIEDYAGTKTVSFMVNPKATTLNSLKAASKAITVSFKSQTKEMDGYYIQYSTDKNFKKNVKKVTVSKGKTSHKLTKLSGSKKYYVRIATYKKVGGKIYTSKWSAAKSTTTKK